MQMFLINFSERKERQQEIKVNGKKKYKQPEYIKNMTI